MKRRTAYAYLFGLLALLAFIVVALMAGSYHISAMDVINTLFGNGTQAQSVVVFQLRLPRICIALLVGIALSTAGCILQSITKNPLAEPGIIGINAGAAFAVVLLISIRSSNYYDVLPKGTVYLMPLVSLAGAFISGGLVYFLAYKKGIKPIRLILVGIGVNFGITALITLYQLNMTKGDYNQALTWINGSLWGSSWIYVIMAAPLILLFYGMSLYKSKVLDVLSLGDELATGLGVSVEKQTRQLLCIAVVLAAIATSVAGNIAFLGLLGPHIGKSLVGPKHKRLLVIAPIISCCLIVLADTISRNLFSPLEIPVGITLSIIGVPYFVYLMMKEK